MVLPPDVNDPLAPLVIGVTAPVTAFKTTGTVDTEAATPPAPRVNALTAAALERRSVLLALSPLKPISVAFGMVKEDNPLQLINITLVETKALLVIVAPVRSQLLKKTTPVYVEGIVIDPDMSQSLKLRLPAEVPEITRVWIATLEKE
jgi:hypothetical protein